MPSWSRCAARFEDWLARPDGEWAGHREVWFVRHPGARCFLCPSTDVQLHHRTYERIAEPLDEDLVPLCASHHAEVHVYVAGRVDDEDSLLNAHEILLARLGAQQRGERAQLDAREREDRNRSLARRTPL